MQIIAVIIIVAVAVFIAIRHIIRVTKNNSKSCTGCLNCTKSKKRGTQ